ncbi:MAG TPA: TetR/AcrR family transcriptional regulator [Micromonosporaceae bacterium]|jgi:AcrR family transcriptional regulator
MSQQPPPAVPPARASSLRARVRAEMTEAIKQTARRHLAEQGAPNLSLRAVAREMGFVSSAVYRYYASRDQLLTALIIDGYNSLGAAAEAAEAGIAQTDLAGRFAAVCHAVLAWARANPHEYALLYGSPVPGYRAPQDTVGPATRITNLLGAILVQGSATGALGPPAGEVLAPAVRAEMAALADTAFPGVPATVIARGLLVWAALFGAVSFDVFNRIEGIIADRDAWFDHQVAALARYVGLGPQVARRRPGPRRR